MCTLDDMLAVIPYQLRCSEMPGGVHVLEREDPLQVASLVCLPHQQGDQEGLHCCLTECE